MLTPDADSALPDGVREDLDGVGAWPDDVQACPDGVGASMLVVAEGYPTARSAYQLARQHGVTTPVRDEVYAMLYEGKNVGRAVRDLMGREPKPE